MLINGKDISIYGGKVLSFTATPAQKDYAYEFLNDNALTPIRTKNSERKFKKIVLEITVTASNEQQFEIYVGDITKELTDCEIVMDDRDNLIYFGHIEETPEIEMQTSTFGKLTCEIYAICKGAEITCRFTKSITFTVQGNSDTPAVLELTSELTLQNLNITGLSDEPIIIKTMNKDSTFIIDGDKCNVTQDGQNKFKNCDMWQFPVLKPGTTTVELSQECNAVLKYNPRYI